jgi:recombinational DNA repair ATPase RecF
MKLKYIELAGFRGFRSPQRIDFGVGFTVISGRNGVGKSTICDAIEFVLVGEIGKYAVETAARESVSDYIWWRGAGPAPAYFVRAAFAADDGRDFVVTRSREGGCDRSDAEIIDALCQGAYPEDPLRQLARTGIIRDEWIAALSLDLSETQRFELVRSALGAIEGNELANKAKEVLAAADNQLKAADGRYEDARLRLSNALAAQSAASQTAANKVEIGDALNLLRTRKPGTEEEEELGVMLNRVRRNLPSQREHVDAMADTVFHAHELAQARKEFDGEAARRRRDDLARSHETAKATLAEAAQVLQLAERAHDIELRASEIAGSLSLLVEHGESLGLHDGHCPLCAAPQTPDAFARGLSVARRRIDELANGMNAAAIALNAAQVRNMEATAHNKTAEAAWMAELTAERGLRMREEEQLDRFLRLEMPLNLIGDLDGLDRLILHERNQLIEIERALLLVDGSRDIDQLAALEAKVAVCRDDVARAGDDLAQAETALSGAKSLEKSVKRSASEIVDERLALISPLLNELYQRLRPHSDWRNIEYSVRGDVKRFLSLKVGDGLNPQFVFSSGQRRAAGLAFLLSVHLACSWSAWSTLVLDDPVQHIDDFRALHLVEVLAALRAGGRQIICAVEDEALADLLCRRLASTDEQPGRRVTIDIDAISSGDVVSQNDVAPMPLQTLNAAILGVRAV